MKIDQRSIFSFLYLRVNVNCPEDSDAISKKKKKKNTERNEKGKWQKRQIWWFLLFIEFTHTFAKE